MKDMQDTYSESHKTSLREGKDLYKWEDIHRWERYTSAKI